MTILKLKSLRCVQTVSIANSSYSEHIRGVHLVITSGHSVNRASCSLWLIQRGVLHLKCGCFGIWPIERGILHVKHAFLVYGL